jgi:ectoine hydroxylase-related dioxygenase (phytanoyl-CoA dioxygenase family)
MTNSTVAALAHDERLLALAQSELGSQATPFRATLFEKSGKSNWLVPWHQDTALPLTSSFDVAGWGPWSKKEGLLYAHAPTWALSRVMALRIHLDASTIENGPLRVVDGSHTTGVLTDKQVLEYARAHSRTDCLVPQGGVLAMRPLLIHSSSKARTPDPRRVLHIEYAESLDLAPGILLAIA